MGEQRIIPFIYYTITPYSPKLNPTETLYRVLKGK